MTLLFEREFKPEEDPKTTVRLAEDCREAETDDYVEDVYFGVEEKRDEIDALIAARAIGWKTKRMSKLSLTVLRMAIYEMKYRTDIPFSVSINEAVELTKTYDGDKAPAFVNGILNGVAEDLGLKNGEKKG